MILNKKTNNKNLIKILVAIILVGIIFMPCYNAKRNPEKVIERKILLTLPKTSNIIHFKYYIWNKRFATKIQINDHDIEKIKEDLLKYFEMEYDKESNQYIPNIGLNVSWWDLDDNNIEVCYFIATDGTKHIFFPL